MNDLELSAKAVFKNYTPATYAPDAADMFIGPARKIAGILEHKAAECIATGTATKLLFYGPPGTGKTALANFFAHRLAEHPVQIESYNGRNATVDRVRHWQEALQYLPLYGKYFVKIVNELDLMPTVAQDACLSYLDEMGPCHCVIGTSNLNLTQLSERFQTRFQQYKVAAPQTSEVVDLLRQWKLSPQEINQIAVGSGGNVRAALLDCQSFLDAKRTTLKLFP